MRKLGAKPATRRRVAVIAVVVLFPWLPATPMLS
jgi:hypothetical protein